MPSSSSPFSEPNAIFTVSQLNQRARQLLEISLTNVRVEGEISNLSRPASGHWYFTLKDAGAQVRCAMFRSRTSQLKFFPKEGDHVELRAKVSLYEQRGDYQLIVDHMKPAGEGALLMAFENLKRALQQEGLFDDAHKQPLPVVRRLAIITSPTGAVIRDMLTILKRRDPSIEVDVYPTQVQGKAATEQIVSAIQRANRDRRADLIILARGGGSLEDLWCFNEEAVARAVFASQLPIVSAIGHEPDVTIADYVADVRAPTPSAAAELISREREQSVQLIQQFTHRLYEAQQRSLSHYRQVTQYLSQRLSSPIHQIRSHQQYLDQLSHRMQGRVQQTRQDKQQHLTYLRQRLGYQDPIKRLEIHRQTLNQLRNRLQQQMKARLDVSHQQLAHHTHVLNSVSPLQVLSRGYSVTHDKDENVIFDAQVMKKGDRLHTRLHKGWLVSQITEIHSD